MKPKLADAPADLYEFLEALASAGISATLPTAGPNDPLAEPIAVRAPLSTAIFQERHE